MTKVIDTAMYTEGTYTQDLTRQAQSVHDPKPIILQSVTSI